MSELATERLNVFVCVGVEVHGYRWSLCTPCATGFVPWSSVDYPCKMILIRSDPRCNGSVPLFT